MSAPPPNAYMFETVCTGHSDKTAEFANADGSGALLAPFYIGPANYPTFTNENQQTFAQQIINQMNNQAPAYIKQQIAAQGITVYDVVMENVTVQWEIVNVGTAYTPPIVPFQVADCKAHVTWQARVFTDKSIVQSPQPEWIVTLLKAVLPYVIAAIIAYWVIQAAKAVLTSMVTDTTTTTYYNPDGSVKEVTSTTNPNPFGSLVVIGGVAAVVFIGIALIFGRRK